MDADTKDSYEKYEMNMLAGFSLLEQARRSFERASESRPAVKVVQIVHLDEDAHKCSDECGDNIHMITEADLERYYNDAVRRLDNVKQAMGAHAPVHQPTYAELMELYRILDAKKH